MLHPLRSTTYDELHAVQDVSLEIAEGEFFGIVGRNGSGKSTLLKCIAGIYGTDRGRISIAGRLSPFIELGVGFNMDLPARDNIVLNGIMMGLSPREARARYDRVIDFAELREFETLKLKNYSSGMLVRLAFSVAIQVDADILLIDEVFAVGDAAFMQKCFDVFHRMRDEGKTIVFVTHSMALLNQFCHRAMLLERGEMVYIGEPQEVGDRYLEINFGRDPQPAGERDGQVGDGDARVVDVWLETARGKRQTAVPQGQRVTVRAKVHFLVDVDDPEAGLYVLNEDHKAVLVFSTTREGGLSGRFTAGEDAVFSFSFDNVLATGRYSPMLTLAHSGSGLDVIDRFESGFSFIVTGLQSAGGLVDLPVDVAVSRADAVTRPEALA